MLTILLTNRQTWIQRQCASRCSLCVICTHSLCSSCRGTIQEWCSDSLRAHFAWKQSAQECGRHDTHCLSLRPEYCWSSQVLQSVFGSSMANSQAAGPFQHDMTACRLARSWLRRFLLPVPVKMWTMQAIKSPSGIWVLVGTLWNSLPAHTKHCLDAQTCTIRCGVLCATQKWLFCVYDARRNALACAVYAHFSLASLEQEICVQDEHLKNTNRHTPCEPCVSRSIEYLSLHAVIFLGIKCIFSDMLLRWCASSVTCFFRVTCFWKDHHWSRRSVEELFVSCLWWLVCIFLEYIEPKDLCWMPWSYVKCSTASASLF